MKLKTLPMEARAVVVLCVMQILFKIVFESEGAQRLIDSSEAPLPGNMPLYAVAGLGVVWLMLTLWSLLYRKLSYVFIMGFAALNLFPLVLVWFGKTPFVGRPFFNGWMTLSLIYFAYQAHKNYVYPMGRDA
ncbi:MAG: hypothetical protein D6E12_02480 [Desulfovibrio sp.]|nr:MAG: hypothetical protein D6E12_02480 [Desulfovibrio sp.]